MLQIPYGTQQITDEDVAAVVEALKSPFLTQGPVIKEFEQAVAAYHGAKYGVAFSNGTAALHGAYYALGVTTGDEVLVPAITFAATSNAALFLGAKPVFIDIDPLTNCMDLNLAEKAITENTKVIAPVDLAGYPLDMEEVGKLARAHNCKVVLDACHALGCKRNGTFGMDYIDAAIFSFHPVKHVTTGEGGMVLTNDPEVYDRLQLFRSHGITKDPDKLSRCDGGWYYEMIDLGYNYRITEIQAALGVSQFKRIESNLTARNRIAKRYDEALCGAEKFILPPNVGYDILTEGAEAETIHSYHLYTLRCANPADRKPLYDYLRENGVFAQIHYIPVPHLPYYANTFGYKQGDFPQAEEYYASEISIPMYHSLPEESQEYVIEKLLAF